MIKKIMLGIFFYLVCMIALFPARILVAYAPIPKTTQISGIEGTLWQGSASQVTVQNRQLEQVQWQLNPWALLLGKVELALTVGSRATAVNGKGLLSYSFSGLSMEDVRLNVPSSFLLGKQRLPFNTKAQGELELMLANYQLDLAHINQAWCETLTGKAFLNQLDIRNQFGEYPLGNITLNLSCDQGQVVAYTDSQDNQLGLSGQVALSADKQVALNARLSPVATTPESIRNALSFLGKPDATGAYPLQYQGAIPGL